MIITTYHTKNKPRRGVMIITKPSNQKTKPRRGDIIIKKGDLFPDHPLKTT
jgi:hypothetical protein